MTLLAYHGKPTVKAKYLRRMKAHIKADELVAGIGFMSNGATRGCFVGCTFDRYDHSLGPTEIGYPEEIMYLADVIHEGLARSGAVDTAFAIDVLDITPGADLSMVWPRYALWLLTEHLPPQTDRTKAAIDGVAVLYREWIETGTKPNAERWAAAAWAAEAAALGAARAAGAAAGAAADSWRAQRDKLVQLLREATVQRRAKR